MTTVTYASSSLPTSTIPLSGLARALVRAGQLSAPAARAIADAAAASKNSFVAQLLSSSHISAADLAHQIALNFGNPLLDLDTVDPAKLPRHLLDSKLCSDHNILPIYKRGHRLVVATADPTHQETAEKIKFACQMSIDWVIVEHDKLIKFTRSNLPPSLHAPSAYMAENDFQFDDTPTPEFNGKDSSSLSIEDAPVVKFLHKMLINAVNMKASDLHFEPYEHHYRVRFRIDGELREMATPPIDIKDKLASRIKVISRLDISEKRVPQDGRMKLKMPPDRIIDFRVSTLPTLFGEKIVIRILDPNSAKMGIDALGYDSNEKQRLLDAIHRPYGMILVTGPTGSGKTVSLYTCLHILNQPGVNISTAEDPSEINMPGVNQVNVNDRAGLTFATSLRAFLRQDPDVIMVGEVRDLETADIALKAAQTGHMVLSTLHTNDAPSAITRLRNMGVEPFNIASSVILITAQRLVRCLCPHCKQPSDVPVEALLTAGFEKQQLDGSWVPYKAVGCSDCNNGYKGRIGIYQVMPISEATQKIILQGGSAIDIAAQTKREGINSLRESGLKKVLQGITSLEEVLAVTNS